LALQTDHERLIGLLTQAGVNTQLPLVVILEQCSKGKLAGETLVHQLRQQWENYMEHIHRVNSAFIQAAAADDPDYFRKFCNVVTFDTCFQNPLWAACSRPGVADTSVTLYPLLSTRKPLRPKRPLPLVTAVSRAPKSENVLEFARLLLTRAKARAKYEELSHWRTTKLVPLIQRLTARIDKARAEAIDAVKDDSKVPEAADKLTQLCDKSKSEWKEAFAPPDGKDDGEEHRKQVAEALQQLTQESSALEAKNHTLLVGTPATLGYLSAFLTYLVASSMEGTISEVAAVTRNALTELKQLVEESRAEPRICSDQEDTLNTATGDRRAKRVRRETKDPESKDIRGAVTWLNKLDDELHGLLHRLREAIPSPNDFAKAREYAFSCAVYLDYAAWVQGVLRLVNPHTTILEAMAAVTPAPSYINWLKKHEQEAREKAAIEVDNRRRSAVASADSLRVRLQDLNKWYTDLVAELRRTQDDLDASLLATPKPWNEKLVTATHRHDVWAIFVSVRSDTNLPLAPRLADAARSVKEFVGGNRAIHATTYRALQAEMETYLLGAIGLWLCE
jgi:hypothetical protein